MNVSILLPSLSQASLYCWLTYAQEPDRQDKLSPFREQFYAPCPTVDYLLKPVDNDLLVDAVKRAAKRINDRQPGKLVETLLYILKQEKSSQQMKLCISTLKGLQVVDLKGRLYCKASSNYTNFYFTNSSSLCTSKSMQEYEIILLDCKFFRIHKSYIINLLHLKEYQRGEGGIVVLSNQKQLEVSRKRKEDFLKKIKSFYKM